MSMARHQAVHDLTSICRTHHSSSFRCVMSAEVLVQQPAEAQQCCCVQSQSRIASCCCCCCCCCQRTRVAIQGDFEAVHTVAYSAVLLWLHAICPTINSVMRW
jgi:hypothetical protein